MTNLKWCVISTRYSDEKQKSPRLEEMTICSNKEDAISKAEREWKHLSSIDKKYAKVIAGTCNIDEEEQNYYCDEKGNYDADIYDIAWDSSELVEDEN